MADPAEIATAVFWVGLSVFAAFLLLHHHRRRQQDLWPDRRDLYIRLLVHCHGRSSNLRCGGRRRLAETKKTFISHRSITKRPQGKVRAKQEVVSPEHSKGGPVNATV